MTIAIVEPAERVCLTCGARGGLEKNEPAGRWNEKRVYVPQCARCHRIHTGGQFRFGFDLGFGERTPLEVAWALFVGVLLVMAQIVRSECECLEDRARSIERGAQAFAYASSSLRRGSPGGRRGC